MDGLLSDRIDGFVSFRLTKLFWDKTEIVVGFFFLLTLKPTLRNLSERLARGFMPVFIVSSASSEI